MQFRMPECQGDPLLRGQITEEGTFLMGSLLLEAEPPTVSSAPGPAEFQWLWGSSMGRLFGDLQTGGKPFR